MSKETRQTLLNEVKSYQEQLIKLKADRNEVGDATIEELAKALELERKLTSEQGESIKRLIKIAEELVQESEGFEDAIDKRVTESLEAAKLAGAGSAEESGKIKSYKLGDRKALEDLKYGGENLTRLEAYYKNTPGAELVFLDPEKMADAARLLQKTDFDVSASPFAGSSIASTRLYATLLEANPFKPYVTVENVMSPSYFLPRVTGEAAESEDEIASSHGFPSGGTTPGSQKNVTNYVKEEGASNFARLVHPGLDNVFRNVTLPQGMAAREAIQTAAAMEAIQKTGSNSRQVTSGVAATLGANAEAVVKNFDKVRRKVPIQYWTMDAMYFVSVDAHDVLFESLLTRSVFIDPRNRLQMYNGFPVMPTGYLPEIEGNSFSVYFGNLMLAIYMGVFLGIRTASYVGSPHPRAAVFDIQQAFSVDPWNEEAIAVLKTAA